MVQKPQGKKGCTIKKSKRQKFLLHVNSQFTTFFCRSYHNYYFSWVLPEKFHVYKIISMYVYMYVCMYV